MPIYAYRCTNCGFKKDFLQKMSDAQLTLCPECKTENLSKQVTAAGFQLKGSGWYATDFKGDKKPATESATEVKSSTVADAASSAPAAAPAAPAATPSPPPTATPST